MGDGKKMNYCIGFLFLSITLLPFVSTFCGNGQRLECSIPWFGEFVDQSLTSASKMFEPACIFHDYCYRHGPCTFGETKQSCDDQFLRHMEYLCSRQKRGFDLFKCLAEARLFHGGVELFGDPYWVPQDCSLCRYKNIVVQHSISSNETQLKLQALFDTNLYSKYYFPEQPLDSTALFQNFIQEGAQKGKMPSIVFDPQFYLMRYYELYQLFGPSGWENATNHFVEQGQSDGRQGSILFEPQWYISTYNLSSQFSSFDYQSIYTEYLTTGLAAGRAGSIAWDPQYYLQRYEDVATMSRTSTNPYHEAAIHFIVQGLMEGRVGSALFNAADYLASNEQLRTSLGNTSYYWASVHYFVHGR